jgi:hypothetical protein
MVVTKSTAENRNRIETRDVMLKSINMRRRVKYTVSDDTTSLDTYGTCRSKTKTKNYSSIFEAVHSFLIIFCSSNYSTVLFRPLSAEFFPICKQNQNRPFSKPEKTFALTQYTVHRTVDITKWNTALGVG